MLVIESACHTLVTFIEKIIIKNQINGYLQEVILFQSVSVFI